MRILLIRTSALGDIVHCLPVLTALRRHRPEGRIGWIVEDSMAPVLEGHPDLDELLPVRLRPWRKRPFAPGTLREIGRFMERLREFSPDAVIDLMGNHKAGVIAGLTLSDRILGAAREDRREPSSVCWIGEPVALRGTHVTERNLSLLRPLGIPDEPVDFGGEKLFPGATAPEGLPERFFLLHPGSAWPNKLYPAELWGEAAARLGAETALPGVVVHGPGEGELARATVEASAGALRIQSTGSLAALAATIRRADLMLGSDTGPLHLGHALGTPVLCLMGPTSPATHGPAGDPEASLYRELPCSFCHRRFDEPKACLTTLPPAEVAGRALALLDRRTA